MLKHDQRLAKTDVSSIKSHQCLKIWSEKNAVYSSIPFKWNADSVEM